MARQAVRPGSTIRRAMASASMTGTPRSRNMLDTVLLPVATPPCTSTLLLIICKMQRELKSERKRQGCGSGSAWIRIYFLHFLQGKSRENARKLVIKIGILLGTIFTINLDQLHDFFYTFEHFFYFQLQKALEKAIFHIRWIQISIKKAAGYGSALRKTAGSGSAKMNADPQPCPGGGKWEEIKNYCRKNDAQQLAFLTRILFFPDFLQC